MLPDGWEQRLVPVVNANTRGITGWCLEPHDLVLSKLVAGCDKDLAFVTEALRHRLVRRQVLRERLTEMRLSDAHHNAVAARIDAA